MNRRALVPVLLALAAPPTLLPARLAAAETPPAATVAEPAPPTSSTPTEPTPTPAPEPAAAAPAPAEAPPPEPSAPPAAAPTAPAPAAAPQQPGAVAPTLTTPAPREGAAPSAHGQRQQPTSGREEQKRDDEPESQRGTPQTAAPGGVGGAAASTTPAPADGLDFDAPIGVPNFFIDSFRIPPFLLPIYQAAGIQYGIRWEILAAINEIETDYGRNLNVSSAGAQGWMQFMPATWQAYGVDGNRDGTKDPYNPVDAIFAAARYLRAAGADDDLRKAIFAYNHAEWYVDSVLRRGKLIAALPSELIDSLSGLTQGLFPVAGASDYPDAVDPTAPAKDAPTTDSDDGDRRQMKISAEAGTPVTAIQDGTIEALGESERLGRFVRLRDAYGNTYTYAHLKKLAAVVPRPNPESQSAAAIADELKLPNADPVPTTAASEGVNDGGADATAEAAIAPIVPAPADPNLRGAVTSPAVPASVRPPLADEETSPSAGSAPDAAVVAATARRLARDPDATGQAASGASLPTTLPADATFGRYFTIDYGLQRKDVTLKPLAKGQTVIAGTILGRIGTTKKDERPHVLFEIRPAGTEAPRIDPKPILDGWRLLTSTAVFGARGRNAILRRDSSQTSVGEILLMDKQMLQQRVLTNPRIEIYSCGRRDIRAGAIDRRVLATLEFLAANDLKPTVTSIRCGHGTYTTSGNVSEHTTGTAVDIAAINGIPMIGHQGKGSITDVTVRRLLTLQGTMKPHQIISLMEYEGTDNTLAMPDHHDHVHVGWRPTSGQPAGTDVAARLRPGQWAKLLRRLGRIDNPAIVKGPRRGSRTRVSADSSKPTD